MKIYIRCLLLLTVALAGCKSGSILQCPNISEVHIKPARHLYFAHLTTKLHNTQKPVTAYKSEETAAIEHAIPVSIKMPGSLSRKLESNNEIEEVNNYFTANSSNRVSLERNEKGQIYFKARSINDVVKLSRTLLATARHPSPAAPAGGGLAIAGGVLGIVGLLMALGPYVGLASFIICLLAIIFGALGLPSPRHGWAVAGIVLGVIGIVVAAALTGVFVVVLHLP